jgi:hypothetical protein
MWGLFTILKEENHPLSRDANASSRRKRKRQRAAHAADETDALTVTSEADEASGDLTTTLQRVEEA